MVLVSEIKLCKNQQGEQFVALVLTGGLELVTSQTTGKFYATVRKANIPCTFDAEAAKQLIGTRIEGEICKIPCEPYLYKTKEGEEVTLDYTYEYRKEVLEVSEFVIS